jgi:hypothetical protein
MPAVLPPPKLGNRAPAGERAPLALLLPMVLVLRCASRPPPLSGVFSRGSAAAVPILLVGAAAVVGLLGQPPAAVGLPLACE